MVALLILLLVQDRPIEASVEAFLKGDKSARAELVKAGAYAILPLQKAREKSPEKIDALVLELKKAAAYPPPKDFIGNLQGTVSVEGEKPLTLSLIKGFGRIPFFLDTFDPAKLKTTKVTLTDITSSLDAAQEICLQTGLDYGWFHNHIVIGLPERLWPSGPPPKWGPLTAEEQKKAKSLVEQLDDKSLETCEKAEAELMKFGPRVIPLLESQLKRKEVEIADRCASLIPRLRPRAGSFGPAAVMRQDLGEKEQGLLRRFNLKLPGQGWHQNLVLERIVKNFQKDHSLDFDLRDDHASKTVTIGLSGRLVDFLSLMTQCLDLDFAIRGRDIVIDSRGGIEKLMSEVK